VPQGARLTPKLKRALEGLARSLQESEMAAAPASVITAGDPQCPRRTDCNLGACRPRIKDPDCLVFVICRIEYQE
jgi:hypothetical protein